MAMGLSLLGREGDKRFQRGLTAGVHVLGAVMAGAAVGALVGWVGQLLSINHAKPWVIAGATIAMAAMLLVRRRLDNLGLHKQVPKDWPTKMPHGLAYFLWGALLGSALLTVIPYSALLLIVVGEATVGPVVAAAAGASFGLGREITAILMSASGKEAGRL